MDGTLELESSESPDLVLHGGLDGRISTESGDHSFLDGDLSGDVQQLNASLESYGTLNAQVSIGSGEGNTLEGDLSNETIFLEGMLSSPDPVSNSGDYNDLRNKPSVHGVKLIGDRSFEELGMKGSENIDFDSGTIAAIELTEAQTAALLS